MLFKAILLAGDRSNATLGIVGIGLGFLLFGDDGDSTSFCELKGTGQTGDTTSQNEKIKKSFLDVFFGNLAHFKGSSVQRDPLSIKRVLPA